MNMLIRLLKWMFRVVGYAVASILVLVILAVCFIGFTVAGSRFAAEQISALISTPDQTVTISDASGLLTGKLRLGAVVVSDTKGTFAELHDIAVDWSPLALINRRFERVVEPGRIDLIVARDAVDPGQSVHFDLAGSSGTVALAGAGDRVLSFL